MLDLLELITGLRMNHAYVRPGGVSQDLPAGALEQAARVPGRRCRAASARYGRCSTPTRSSWAGPKNVAYLDLVGCMALGVTGPILRATGLPWDLRKSQPYCGYETYEFDRADPGHLRRLRPRTPSGWTRWTSRSRSSSSAWTGWPPSAPPTTR